MREQAVISRRYAKALFEVAQDVDALQAVAQDLLHLHDLIEKAPDLRHFFYSKVVDSASLTKIVEELTDKLKCHEVTKSFVRLLAQKRRLSTLKGIFVRYPQLLAANRKEMTAQVTTAREMTKGQMADLKKVLENRTGFQVALMPEVNPDILGGMIVRLGGFESDSSLRTQLKDIHLSLQEVR